MDQQAEDIDTHLKERALDEAPVGIVISNPDMEDNPLIYANATFEQLTGYPRDEIIGRNCRFLQGEDSSQDVIDQMRHSIDDGQPISVELINYTREGDPFWNEVTIAPIRDEHGSITNFVGFQSDVTTRKEAELEIERRREELEYLIGRIDGLIHDITEALMRATGREETEQQICELIVDEDPYTVAWVGELDIVSETIEVTSIASQDGPIEPSPVPLTDEHPVSSAIIDQRAVSFTEETYLAALGVDEIATAGAAAPLAYGNRTYGVLVILSDAIGSFDGPESVVIRTLGRTISTAINAAESRRILTDDTVSVIEITITDSTFPLVSEGLATTSTLEGVVSHEDGSLGMFLSVEQAGEWLQTVLGEHDTVASVRTVSSIGEDGLFDIRFTHDSILSQVASQGVRITDVIAGDEQVTLRLDVPATIDPREVVDLIKQRHPTSDLIALRQEQRPPMTRSEFMAEIEGLLTHRQLMALQTAYFGGYFDPSRKTTGDELAQSMSISRATFHQHLRAAERKLVGSFLDALIDAS